MKHVLTKYVIFILVALLVCFLNVVEASKDKMFVTHNS